MALLGGLKECATIAETLGAHKVVGVVIPKPYETIV
jgi:hypothetical protein